MIATVALDAIGWHPVFAAAFEAHEASGRVPARVVAEERGQFLLHDGSATLAASVSGRLRYESGGDPLAFPSVGDWVVAAFNGGGTATIHGLMPRRSAIVRRAPSDHSTGAQVLAANVDVVFIVSSLNAEMNLRRLERYLAVAWESGALPVVVLSKADLDDDVAGHLVAAAAVAPGVEIIAASAVSGEGIEAVRAHLAPGRTVAFIGSSGVGKSTLVNALAGRELLTTAGIREDDARGRHTTTRRQLVPLADGLVIDTPGMRELGLLDGDGLASAFDDVETTARGCRFSDCRHQSEPGCAVRAALATGDLDPDRFRAYRKLEREARRSELANDAVARKAERRRWTSMIRGVERHMQQKYGGER
ncbi:MAG TPA: ribosome small subunit-dependent GTPase A [Candidatus Limnocylindrales bacterium]|nr:ribosome small subunit-dependent GTPase A [Candidatus Limnocylindrales bacterium]